MSWKETVDSVAKLELLLFFHHNPKTMDTAASLAIWTGLDQRDAEMALTGLVNAGLVKRSGEIFHYAPPETAAPVIQGAVEAYRTQRIALRGELVRAEAERRELSQSLRAERNRGEAVLESINEAIVLDSTDGGLEPLNDQARQLLPGIETGRREDLGTEILAAIDKAKGATDRLVECTAQDRILRVRARHLEAGTSGGHVLTFYDVTSDVEAERLKQDLTRMITHDLRSPAGGIATAFELLLREGPESLNVKHRRIAEVGRRSTAYILSLVNNLLDIGRLEDGRMTLALSPYHLEDLAEEAMGPLEGLLGERRVKVRRSYPETSRTRVMVDRELIVRVLGNLIANAVKFSEPDGELEIATGQSAEGAYASVRDFGPGIPEDELTRVFEKYYRVAGGKASQVGGTGLGLYFVRLVAEAHGGQITAENVEPGGCKFALRLPQAPRLTV